MRQLKISQSITNRDSLSLEKYLQDIFKIELLSNADEEKLAKLIREGDNDAFEKLTKANLRFVVSVAKQYQGQGMSLSDLINEGNIGLIKAANRYDETKGFKFISYAVWWIRQSIMHSIADKAKIIRIPFSKMNVKSKITKMYAQLEQEFEREPSTEEIAFALQIKNVDVINNIMSTSKHSSIDQPIGEDEGCMSDFLEDKNSNTLDAKLIKLDLDAEINNSFKILSPRQKDVLNSFFGLGYQTAMTLEDIGEKYCLTRERVRQIKDKALHILQIAPSSKNLRTYLG